ncbi:MAG: hypothetical protein IIT98_04695 [Kiritimatiellae bacterium]|nr:hypothetical protein [Kiritimatiellia bacterium]
MAFPPPRFTAAVQGWQRRKNDLDAICGFLINISGFQSIIPPQNISTPDRDQKRPRSSGKTFSIVWSNDPERLGKRSRTFNQMIEKVFREEREPSAKISRDKIKNYSIIDKNAILQNVELCVSDGARASAGTRQ